MIEQQKTFDTTSRTELVNHQTDSINDIYEDDINSTKRIKPIPSSHDYNSIGKLVKTHNARILDWNDFTVKVEVLVNKEEGLFEARNFPVEIFLDSDLLNYHQLIRIFTYLKRKEISIKIEDGSHFVSKEIFPNEKLLTNLKSDLFKFK